jgi:hypothetical protein
VFSRWCMTGHFGSVTADILNTKLLFEDMRFKEKA